MSVAVGEIDGVVGTDVNMVGLQGDAIPPLPGIKELAVPVEYQHRWPLALEHVHPVHGIHGYAAGGL